MAGMFYTLQEAAEKLNKTEEEVKQIIEQGKLRGFRDGPSIFLKIDEVETFVSEESVSVVPEEPQVKEPEPALISVEPEPLQPEEQELPSPEFKEEETKMSELEETEPQVPEEEFDIADMEKLVEEIPAVKAVTAQEAPTAQPQKAMKKPRSRAEPQIKQARKSQRLSFGQWLLYSLTEDNPVAIFVLVLISCLVLSALAALGYGFYFLYINF